MHDTHEKKGLNTKKKKETNKKKRAIGGVFWKNKLKLVCKCLGTNLERLEFGFRCVISLNKNGRIDYSRLQKSNVKSFLLVAHILLYSFPTLKVIQC